MCFPRCLRVQWSGSFVLLVHSLCGSMLCQGLWRRFWHATLDSGLSVSSKVYFFIFSIVRLSMCMFWLSLLPIVVQRRVCNNVVSRVFTDGRQGGCQRLDRVMDMLQALILITQTEQTHLMLSWYITQTWLSIFNLLVEGLESAWLRPAGLFLVDLFAACVKLEHS